MDKAYRVLAKSSLGDTHLVVTSSRVRALEIFAAFGKAKGWSEPRVEFGSASFSTNEELKKLP